MTAPVALPNDLEAVSHSARVDLFRDTSCNIEKEVWAHLGNGQDSTAGFRVGEIRFANGDIYSGTLLGNTERQAWCSGESCLTESPSHGFEAASPQILRGEGLPRFFPSPDPTHVRASGTGSALFETRKKTVGA